MNGKQMKRKQGASVILDIFIAISTASCLYLLHSFMEPGYPRQILTVVMALPLAILAVYETVSWAAP